MDDTERLLTKADILEGKEKRENVFIKKLGGSLEIRPLTEIQWSSVQAINSRGVSMTTKIEPGGGKSKNFDMTLDLEKSSEATDEAMRLAVSYGVASINLTPEDVGKLRPAGAALEIANHIFGLTGVSLRKPNKEDIKKELVSSFRGK